jgi:hypothetical protein
LGANGVTDLPQPLTPPDCELRNFPTMPLDIARLRRSKAWLVAKRMPEVAFFMMNLWTASWHEKPAASLEDDDDVLADFAMCDPKRWKKIKAEAMRGWIKCSDGRLYHSVVAEMANAAWFKKVLYAWKKECDRIRKANKIRIAQGLQELDFPAEPEQSSFGIPKDVFGIPEEFQEFPMETTLKGEGEERESKGRGKGEVRDLKPKPEKQPLLDDLSVATPKAKKPRKPKAPAEPGTGKAWVAYANAYWQRYNVEPVRNAMVNGQLSQLVKRIGAADAEHVAAFYVGHRHRFYVEKMHPVGLLLADCEKLRTEWATSTQMTATRAQQVDRTQTNLDAFAPLIAAAREREQAEKEAANASK